MHGQVRCQPSKMTPLHYYDSQRTVKQRQRADSADEHACKAEEQAHTSNEQLSEMNAYIQRQVAVLLEQRKMLRALEEVVSRFVALSTGSGEDSSNAGYIYIYK